MPGPTEEYRSRLEAGGTFFRSREVGPDANDITVSVSRGSGETTYTMTLTVSDGDITEMYSAEQEEGVEVDPETMEPIPIIVISAIPSIRSAVNSGSVLIDMPARSSDIVDAQGTDAESGRTVGRSGPPDVEDGLSAFPMTSLYGAQGLITSPIGIRTGPDRTLVHVNRSERDISDGSLVVLNQIRQWSGSDEMDGSFIIYP